MDTEFFLDILKIDSTSGKERGLADFLASRLAAPGRTVEIFETGDGTCSLLVSWGSPDVFFCTHLDTVPPYIPPSVSESSDAASNADRDLLFSGRGTCDAKGQIAAMYEACLELERRGQQGFALLLLAGEETGSFGAKAFTGMHPGGDWLIVGEPTDNCMASAAKGTKAFEVTFSGKAFHSGYPQYGESAVIMFNSFLNALNDIAFPVDNILGDTTWNIGRLFSDNPQNILSDRLTFRIYFRTTFETDAMVSNLMDSMIGDKSLPWQRAMTFRPLGGDTPSVFRVFPGFKSKPVAFGSDAPHLKGFRNKILCGPGSILVAHTDKENVLLGQLREAADNYVKMFEYIKNLPEQQDRPENM
ncbi:MAG: M20/M25/M40 family metallo-hydrolase [Bacteroidales bacterium]|nr:M20/M25/M40 family metallo-hydrolase [Bacteroidales bacterium]